MSNLQAILVGRQQNASHASKGDKEIVKTDWLDLKGCTDGNKKCLCDNLHESIREE